MEKISLSILVIVFSFVLNSCTNNETRSKEQSEKEALDNKMSNKNDEKQKMASTCMIPVTAEDSAKYISKQITVSGDVENPLTLTVDSLKNMNVVTIENFTVVCESGANMKENRSCKGVLLKDILGKAKIIQLNHKDRNFYIVARATDNYKASFSWAEIFNNPTGDNVYVIFEENDQAIKAQGEMILICKNDIKTGPRHVYWLNSIEVNRID